MDIQQNPYPTLQPVWSVRDPVEVALRYRSISESRWLRAQAVDISDTGVLFQGQRKVAPGTELEMYLVQTDMYGREIEPLTICRGTVVRSQAGHPGKRSTVSVAVQFCK